MDMRSPARIGILAVTLAMQTGRTTTPLPPNPRWWKFVTALMIALAIVLTLALSGCSTVPARTTPLWSPPQAALAKSEPLPKLADDTAQPDDAKSTIGLPELVDDNFNLVKAYKRLAKRHDELVDAVMAHLRDQAK